MISKYLYFLSILIIASLRGETDKNRELKAHVQIELHIKDGKTTHKVASYHEYKNGVKNELFRLESKTEDKIISSDEFGKCLENNKSDSYSLEKLHSCTDLRSLIYELNDITLSDGVYKVSISLLGYYKNEITLMHNDQEKYIAPYVRQNAIKRARDIYLREQGTRALLDHIKAGVYKLGCTVFNVFKRLNK